jgi:hypothetical protein
MNSEALQWVNGKTNCSKFVTQNTITNEKASLFFSITLKHRKHFKIFMRKKSIGSEGICFNIT